LMRRNAENHRGDAEFQKILTKVNEITHQTIQLEIKNYKL